MIRSVVENGPFIPSLHALSHPLEGQGYQWWSGIGSDFGQLTLITAVLAIAWKSYRHFECHQEKCHKLGRFTHGHYKLCAKHHPNVPSDGKITQYHIDNPTHFGDPPD